MAITFSVWNVVHRITLLCPTVR